MCLLRLGEVIFSRIVFTHKLKTGAHFSIFSMLSFVFFNLLYAIF